MRLAGFNDYEFMTQPDSDVVLICKIKYPHKGRETLILYGNAYILLIDKIFDKSYFAEPAESCIF